MNPLRTALLCAAMIGINGCVGQVIETTTDAAIAVVKVPFKVGGAVIDVANGDDDDKESNDK